MSFQGTALRAGEADLYDNLDVGGIESLLAADEQVPDVRRQRALNDYITLYHPDPNNPSSTYLVPVERKDRRVALLNLMAKTVVRGGKVIQWNHAKPKFEPNVLRFRCFVQGCHRTGGFRTRAQVIAHVGAKHGDEMPMYKPVIDKLNQLVYEDIDPDIMATLGLDMSPIEPDAQAEEDSVPAPTGSRPRVAVPE